MGIKNRLSGVLAEQVSLARFSPLSIVRKYKSRLEEMSRKVGACSARSSRLFEKRGQFDASLAFLQFLGQVHNYRLFEIPQVVNVDHPLLQVVNVGIHGQGPTFLVGFFENLPDEVYAQASGSGKYLVRGPVSPARIISISDVGHDEIRGNLVPGVAPDELDTALPVFNDHGSARAVSDRNPGPFQGRNIELSKELLDILASRARSQEDHQDAPPEGRLAGVGLPTGRSGGISVDEESLVVHPALHGHVVITEHDPAVILAGSGEESRDRLEVITLLIFSRFS